MTKRKRLLIRILLFVAWIVCDDEEVAKELVHLTNYVNQSELGIENAK